MITNTLKAFHPFYVFQIASLILWSLDEYYYYATAIFIISAVSITTTVVETRSTMKRLREISRFECDVRVLRNGFCKNPTTLIKYSNSNVDVKGAPCFQATSYRATFTKSPI